MYCIHCGKYIVDDSVFCGYCGVNLLKLDKMKENPNYDKARYNNKKHEIKSKVNDKAPKKTETNKHMTRAQHLRRATWFTILAIILLTFAVILVFEFYSLWGLAVGVVAICIFLVAINAAGIECPRCKERNVEEISREFIGSEDTVIKKTVEDKVYQTDSYGTKTGYPSQIIRREIMVPAVKKYYRVTYKCPDCGYSYSTKTSSVEEC